ncbi:tRNA-dihydrouridine synthase [Methanopyrus sp.]
MTSVCRSEALRFWRSLGCPSLTFNAPMSGHTGPDLAPELERHGAGMVILGGYPGDDATYRASKLVARRRMEFAVPPDRLPDELSHIDVEVPVAVNTRFTDPRGAEELSGELADLVDIIEVNAHCRQPEIVRAGAGEALLEDRARLAEIVEAVAEHDVYVSVKLRGPHPAFEDALKVLQDLSVDVIHVDAMKPGEPRYELKYVRTAAQVGVPVIGNNSVRTPEDVDNMFDAGASAVSVGRPILEGDWEVLERLSRYTVLDE